MNPQQLADMIGVKYDTAVRLVARGEIPAGVRIIPGTHKVERVITNAAAKAFMAARKLPGRPKKPGLSERDARRLACTIAANVLGAAKLTSAVWPSDPRDAVMVDEAIGDIIRSLEKRGTAGHSKVF